MKQSIAIIGSGPSALLLAAMLDEKKFNITIYERKSTPARKFLVAGDGGFNLTHSEDIESFLTRYTPKEFLENCIRSFTNTDLCKWLKGIGIETWVGSSKRVFPIKGIKPIAVLTAILNQLTRKNIRVLTDYNWIGWNAVNELKFEHKGIGHFIKADYNVFALGGASWSITGSNGSWTTLFKNKGVTIVPFFSSNCAYQIKWDEKFIKEADGLSLKNILITCGNKTQKGEVVITKFGLEGNAIYTLSPQIREQLNKNKLAIIYIDLKPTFTISEINKILMGRGNKSLTKQLLQEINLSKIQVKLLKANLTKNHFTNAEMLSNYIKKLPLQIVDAAPIDEAISTIGGIALNEVDEHFQLGKLPNHFCIGEMLDWDAPTGGYLLQASFSMGNYLANYLNVNENTRQQNQCF